MAMTRLAQALRPWLEEVSGLAVRLARLWGDDLRDTIPIQHRQLLARTFLRAPLVVKLDGDGSPQWMGQPGCPDIVGATGASAGARLLTLRIDEAALLRRRLELPGAAAARLDVTLATNLERWTPFAPEEIYAAAHPLEEVSPRPETRVVELRCAPRSHIDEEVRILRSLGLEPDAIELGDSRFVLPCATRKRRALQFQNWAVAGLAVTLVVQVLSGYVLLSNRQLDEIAGLEADRDRIVAALRRRADSEREATARRDGARRIAARMEDGLSVSRGLSLLGEVLPSDAVVREFEIGRDRADGHVVIHAAAGLDVVEVLGRTGFYRVGDLSVLPGSEADRKIFSAGFTIPAWIQAHGKPAR